MTPTTRPNPADLTWHVSTRSASAGGNCVEVGWRTSTRSSNTGGNCVEVGPVRDASERVAIRDSKDRAGAMLTVAGPQWADFLSAVATDVVRPGD